MSVRQVYPPFWGVGWGDAEDAVLGTNPTSFTGSEGLWNRHEGFVVDAVGEVADGSLSALQEKTDVARVDGPGSAASCLCWNMCQCLRFFFASAVGIVANDVSEQKIGAVILDGQAAVVASHDDESRL